MTLLKHRYTAVAIALHWVIALAIIGMIGLGWYMGDLPNDAPNKGALFQLHKSIGISIFVLTLMRIFWRLMNRPPEEPPMPHLQKIISNWVHVLFYALMVLMPLTGWILVSASQRGLPTILFNVLEWPHIAPLAQLSSDTKEMLFPFLENAHSKLAWVAIVLLALHVVGALKHQFIDKDGLMARMLPGLFGRTDGPQQSGRGGLVAFGGALAVFAVIVGIGMIPSNAETPVEEVADVSEPVEEKLVVTPNWAIDMENSKIGFSGIYNKKPFEGVFNEWDARIQYNPDAPAKAAIIVTVKTATAETGDTYSDKSLHGADFFNTNEFPEAVFEAKGVFVVDDHLELTGVLALKGEDYPVRMPFNLDITDGKAVMTSSFAMNRLALGLGEDNDPNAEWISEDIQMDIQVQATRTN